MLHFSEIYDPCARAKTNTVLYRLNGKFSELNDRTAAERKFFLVQQALRVISLLAGFTNSRELFTCLTFFIQEIRLRIPECTKLRMPGSTHRFITSPFCMVNHFPLAPNVYVRSPSNYFSPRFTSTPTRCSIGSELRSCVTMSSIATLLGASIPYPADICSRRCLSGPAAPSRVSGEDKATNV